MGSVVSGLSGSSSVALASKNEPAAVVLPSTRGQDVFVQTPALVSPDASAEPSQNPPSCVRRALSNGFLSLARTQMRPEHHAKAIRLLTISLWFDPSNLEALWMRAVAYDNFSEPYCAAGDLDDLIARGGGSVEAYLMRGQIRTQRGVPAKGIEDFDQVLGLDPGNPDAFCGRGVARFDVGDLLGALADMDIVEKIDPARAMIKVIRHLAAPAPNRST